MSLGPLTVGVNADGSGFAASAMQALQGAQPSLTQGGLIAGSAIGTAIGNGITSAISGAINLVQGAITGLAGLVQSGIGIGDMLSDTALKLGVSATSLQLYGEVAKQVGVDTEALQSSFSKLNIKVGEALTGNSAAIESFANLGISVQQLAALSPEQRFNLVADAIGRIPDVAVRASEAVDLFGKGGAAIAQSLGDIGIKSEELSARWIALGAVISEENIAAAGGVQDRIDLMGDTFDRFKVLLAGEVAPYIEYALTLMDQLVMTTGGLGPTAAKAAEGFGVVAGYAIDAGQVIFGIGEMVWGVAKAITGVGEYAGAGFAIMVGAAQWGGGKATEFIFGFLADTAQGMRQTGDDIANFFNGVIDSISSAITDSINWLIESWNLIADVIGMGHIDTIQGSQAHAQISTAAGPVEQFLRDSQEFGADLASTGKDLMETAADQIEASTTFADAWKDIESGAANFSDVFSNGPDRWSTAFKDGVAAAADAAAQKEASTAATTGPAKYSNQQLIDQRNAWQGAAVSGGSYSPMVSTPSMARNGIDPVSSNGPPMSFQQNFATGVTAQDLKQAAVSIKRETINAVQTANAKGGTFRNNLKC